MLILNSFRSSLATLRVTGVTRALLMLLTIICLIRSGFATPDRGSSRSKMIRDSDEDEDEHHLPVIISPLSGSVIGDGSSLEAFHTDIHRLDTVSLTDHHHGSTQGVCEPIKIGLCMELGYNETTMPNLVGHDGQADAEALLQTFTPLIQYGCSPHLKLFLCSSHAPMCTDKTPQPIGPCRSLCESVRHKCEPVLTEFGFKWPPPLDCSKFYPENNHQHMCIPGPMDSSHGTGFGFRNPSVTNNGVRERTPLIPSIIDRSGSHSSDDHLVLSNGNVFGNAPSTFQDTSKSVLFRPVVHNEPVESIQPMIPVIVRHDNHGSMMTPEVLDNGQEVCIGPRKFWLKGTCWTKCSSSTTTEEISSLFRSSEMKFARNYALLWAIMSLLSALMALILSLRSQTISTAERPIMYIALCQVFFSIGTTLGTSMSVSCFIDKISSTELLAGHEMVPSPCAVVFLLTYFFGLATNLWWVILCLSWMLSVNVNLRISLQQKERSLFHLVTWGTASIFTSTTLIYKKVDADELTGLCGVGFQDMDALTYYVLIPTNTALGLALLFLSIGLISRICPKWIPAICYCFKSPKKLHSSSTPGSSSCHQNQHQSGARHNQAYSPVLVLPQQSFNHHHHHHSHNCSENDESPSFLSNNPNSANGLQLQRRKALEEAKAIWTRVGIFALVQTIPVACQVCTIVYELTNKESWENGHGRPNLQIFLLRLNMNLIAGLTAGVWVLSTFSWKSFSQKLSCCHTSLQNFFTPKNQELKVAPTVTIGAGLGQLGDHGPSVTTTTSPLLIPVPVNSLATTYVTLNGRSVGPTHITNVQSHQNRPFAGIVPRYHQPAVPPLPARNPEAMQIDGWRRVETIV